MKAAIEVRDRAEADRIKTSMSDETTRAVMNVMGALMPLADKDRPRVLAFVASGFELPLPTAAGKAQES